MGKPWWFQIIERILNPFEISAFNYYHRIRIKDISFSFLN